MPPVNVSVPLEAVGAVQSIGSYLLRKKDSALCMSSMMLTKVVLYRFS